ncbi:MAG: hypothetical protein ACRDWE_07690 [Acidimicrobiales bacterium]
MPTCDTPIWTRERVMAHLAPFFARMQASAIEPVGTLPAQHARTGGGGEPIEDCKELEQL